MKAYIFCGILGLSFGVTWAADKKWDYEDTNKWCKDFEDCCPEKTRQSPVPLVEAEAMSKTFPKSLAYTGPAFSSLKGTLTNNGHTLLFNVDPAEPKLLLSGGALGDKEFALLQFHFHWGKTSSSGSEHSLDGKFYPGEVHFVHGDTSVPATQNLLTTPDGLAVLGMFIELEEDDSMAFKPIIDVMRDMRPKDATKEVEINMSEILALLPTTTEWTTYLGSLTTPGCNEVVIWNNMLRPIKMGRKDFKAIRLIKNTVGSRLYNNYRLPLTNNANPIYKNMA